MHTRRSQKRHRRVRGAAFCVSGLGFMFGCEVDCKDVEPQRRGQVEKRCALVWKVVFEKVCDPRAEKRAQKRGDNVLHERESALQIRIPEPPVVVFPGECTCPALLLGFGLVPLEQVHGTLEQLAQHERAQKRDKHGFTAKDAKVVYERKRETHTTCAGK